MNTKKFTITAILIAIGFILHSIVPPIGIIEMDFSLIFMVIAIFVNKDSLLSSTVVGVVTGLLTFISSKSTIAIANIPDKVITALFIYLIFKFVKDKKLNKLLMFTIFTLATLVSGITFCLVGNIFADIPILLMLFTGVLPATVINGFSGTIIFNLLRKYRREAYGDCKIQK